MNANSSSRLIREWFDLNDDRGLTHHVQPRRSRSFIYRWIGDPE